MSAGGDGKATVKRFLVVAQLSSWIEAPAAFAGAISAARDGIFLESLALGHEHFLLRKHAVLWIPLDRLSSVAVSPSFVAQIPFDPALLSACRSLFARGGTPAYSFQSLDLFLPAVQLMLLLLQFVDLSDAASDHSFI